MLGGGVALLSARQPSGDVADFGELDYSNTMRLVVPGVTLDGDRVPDGAGKLLRQRVRNARRRSIVTSNFQPSDTEFDAYADGLSRRAQRRGCGFLARTRSTSPRARVDWLRPDWVELGHITETVLDYGCGTGSTVPFLLELPGVQRVIATDASAALLDDRQPRARQ